MTEQQKLYKRQYYRKHLKHERQVRRDYQRLHYSASAIRARNLKRLYGLTVEQWEQMFIAQNGLCAICGNWLKLDKSTNTDHDKQTGEVRGLLCNRCNAGIGLLRESPDVLEMARNYLGGV